jgi:3-phosphoshikimate 1-carboxyvinyltransferase
MARKASSINVLAAKQLSGQISLPGDKSISHRAVMLGSISEGITEIRNISTGRDCLATINCIKNLGVKIIRKSGDKSDLLIYGRGSRRLTEPSNVLYAANSATTMRLLSGIVAAQPFFSVINGDVSLRSRPMKRLIEPLRLMGAEIYGRDNDAYAPLTIRGGQLKGIQYDLPVASAQIKSAILLAGLYANGETVVGQPQKSRDHTERMLIQMGAQLKQEDNSIKLAPLTSQLNPLHQTIPGDISSAAYWLVAGAIHPNASLKILSCGINPTRIGIVDILTDMGANLTIKNRSSEGNEPIADLYIESSRLKAVEINKEIIPRLIDEIPVIAVAACFAEGKTTIRDAGELRIKESDRIQSTVKELCRLGADIEELPDGMIITGKKQLGGTTVKSYSDHRLVMSLAVAGLVAKGVTTIDNADAAEISYPGFWSQLSSISGYNK